MTTRERKIAKLNQFGYICFYCRKKLSIEDATLDHIIPRSVQRRVPDNLRPCCYHCNMAKNNLSLEAFSRHIVRIFLWWVIPFQFKRIVHEISLPKMAKKA